MKSSHGPPTGPRTPTQGPPTRPRRPSPPPPEALCIALDAPDIGEARRLVGALGPHVGWFKVGLTLFARHGREAVEVVRSSGRSLFLDLKFCDIPAQVAGAVAAARDMGARLVTVHAAGGRAMIEAAVASRGPGMRVVAVTVPTSLDGPGFGRVWPGEEPQAVVARWTDLAVEAGADGVVLSAREVAAARGRVPSGFFLVVPGLRGPADDVGDQARTGTPRHAWEDGADLLVLGRPVTRSEDPVAALERLLLGGPGIRDTG